MSNASQPQLSVIYVNYNTEELIKNSIESVKKFCRNFTYEIIIVDNSPANKKNFFASLGVELTYVYSSTNLGFGQANNLGVQYAKAEKVLLINPDTLVFDDSLEILYASFIEQEKKYKNLICMGGNLLYGDNAPQGSCSIYYTGVLEEIDNLFFGICSKLIKLRWQRFKKIRNVKVVFGALMMFDKQKFQSVGGFREEYFMYHEEIDLCYRAHKAGYILLNNPFCVIYHLEGKSIMNDSERIEKKRKGRELFLRLNYSKFHIQAIHQFEKVLAFSRYILTFFIRKESHSYWKKILIL